MVDVAMLVNELPTIQITLTAFAPLMSEIIDPLSSVTVDAAQKIKSAFESPCASRTIPPLVFGISKLDVELYLPGRYVCVFAPFPLVAKLTAVPSEVNVSPV